MTAKVLRIADRIGPRTKTQKRETRHRRKPVSTRNKRVRAVIREDWQRERKQEIVTAVEWAGGAKAARTQLGVTQAEMAKALGLSVATVCHRESGFYFGWDKEMFMLYVNIANEIARGE